MMSIDGNSRVGKVAAEHPGTTRIFAQYGIEFCCGGGRPLATVCEDQELDFDAVLAELHQVVEGPDGSKETPWNDAPLADLIVHILATHHEPLKQELPRLVTMARKVLRVHEEKDPERLRALVSTLVAFEHELVDHMAKEENILFPMIKKGMGEMADAPISVMNGEHLDAAATLDKLRSLTDGYVAPEGACTTWRGLWHGLAAMDEELRLHIHLENNILFPRALAG